jgi:hypothetical protein
MSPTRSRARTRKKKKPAARWLLILWPLILGIVATPLAVRGASVLAMSGPPALRLLYPYVVLVQSQSQSFVASQQDTLAQWAMWGQFPAYGLLWMASRRLMRGTGGLLSVVVAHCAGLAAAILTMTGK